MANFTYTANPGPSGSVGVSGLTAGSGVGGIEYFSDLASIHQGCCGCIEIPCPNNVPLTYTWTLNGKLPGGSEFGGNASCANVSSGTLYVGGGVLWTETGATLPSYNCQSFAYYGINTFYGLENAATLTISCGDAYAPGSHPCDATFNMQICGGNLLYTTTNWTLGGTNTLNFSGECNSCCYDKTILGDPDCSDYPATMTLTAGSNWSFCGDPICGELTVIYNTTFGSAAPNGPRFGPNTESPCGTCGRASLSFMQVGGQLAFNPCSVENNYCCWYGTGLPPTNYPYGGQFLAVVNGDSLTLNFGLSASGFFGTYGVVNGNPGNPAWWTCDFTPVLSWSGSFDAHGNCTLVPGSLWVKRNHNT